MNDPKCPKFGQPQIGAIQEEHDELHIINEPINNEDMGNPSMDPIAEEVAVSTQDVEAAHGLSDWGVDEAPLVALQYTLEDEEYLLEVYEQYTDQVYNEGE